MKLYDVVKPLLKESKIVENNYYILPIMKANNKEGIEILADVLYDATKDCVVYRSLQKDKTQHLEIIIKFDKGEEAVISTRYVKGDEMNLPLITSIKEDYEFNGKLTFIGEKDAKSPGTSFLNWLHQTINTNLRMLADALEHTYKVKFNEELGFSKFDYKKMENQQKAN